LARHLGNYLPGRPTVIVSNTPGAGGMVAANRLFNVAPKDGSEIALVPRGVIMEPLVRRDPLARFRSDAFNWIGSMNKEIAALLFWQSPPVSLSDVLSGKRYVVGATGAASDAAIYAHTTNSLLGTNFSIIPAYTRSNLGKSKLFPESRKF
jgi:tripartite-type tricarboxylate transporter receptor subunit TctC